MINTISLIWLIGTLTAAVSILTKIIGLPDQIRKNYIRKSTKGVSSILIILLFSSYSLWTIYGLLKNDWVLIAGHGLGILTTGAIIYQIIKYKKRK